MNNLGYCQCGCNQKTTIATKTDNRWGWIRGVPKRFIQGHNVKNRTGANSHSWKNGVSETGDNYTLIYSPDHPNSKNNRYVLKSRLIAEKALGKFLPRHVVVHHHDGNTKNDKNTNLIVCENYAYHNLIHKRKRAYDACGNVNWGRCQFCKEYDDPHNLYLTKTASWHRVCKNKYEKERYWQDPESERKRSRQRHRGN